MPAILQGWQDGRRGGSTVEATHGHDLGGCVLWATLDIVGERGGAVRQPHSGAGFVSASIRSQGVPPPFVIDFGPPRLPALQRWQKHFGAPNLLLFIYLEKKKGGGTRLNDVPHADSDGLFSRQ